MSRQEGILLSLLLRQLSRMQQAWLFAGNPSAFTWFGNTKGNLTESLFTWTPVS
jgi:hypothetical protein